MASISSSPRTVEEIFKDYSARRAAIVRALTYDVDEFYNMCDPEKENLCLYGHSNETWEVNLPAEEVPPELPEPALGINFARDGMNRRDWLSLVAVHSDCWLLSVAFFFGARLNRNERKRLFSLVNDLATVFEVVSERKPVKDKPSTDSGSKSRGSTKETTNKRPYDQVAVFVHTHRYKARKGESEEQRRWACPRAETANIHYEQMLADLPAEVREKMTPEEREQMWLSCVGGVRRGHVYGMAGSSQNFFHRLESGLRGIGTSAGAEALDREGMEALQEQVTRLTQSLESERAEKKELTTKVGRLEDQMAMILRHFKQPLPEHTWEDESGEEI